jgi:hypothetical protein
MPHPAAKRPPRGGHVAQAAGTRKWNFAKFHIDAHPKYLDDV